MGREEYALPAPPALLEYLVQNITLDQVNASGDATDVLARRTALAQRDRVAIAEAVGEIRAGKRGKRWFILEGDSRPDALLETSDLVLVIEGKRTEGSCTSQTKWMGTRSQLIRHLDAASDAFPGKRVLGLLVVEGDESKAAATTPSVFWNQQSVAQYETEILNASLPHRTTAQRKAIASGILGVTTWQAICAAIGLPWPPSGDVV